VAHYAGGQPLPFEAVADRIAAYLADRNLRVALRGYAHTLLHDTLGEDASVHGH
jgi:hypothetical protein